jgi:hypothetical protein
MSEMKKKIVALLASIGLAAVSGAAGAVTTRVLNERRTETLIIILPRKELPADTRPPSKYSFKFKEEEKEYNLELITPYKDILRHTLDKTLDVVAPSQQYKTIINYEHSPSEGPVSFGVNSEKLEDFLNYYNVDEKSKGNVYKIKEINIIRKEQLSEEYQKLVEEYEKQMNKSER